MQLGYHTSGLQNHRLTDALELLAELGYQAVAITPDTCHLDPDTTTDGELAEVARRLRDLGLRPVLETGARFLLDRRHKHEPTLMTRDRAARQRRLDSYERCAAMAAALGAEVVSFWAGIDRAPGPDSWSWLCDGVAKACERIRAHGRVPSFEPEPGMAVETVADWHRLRSALGPVAPALTLDIGHLYAVQEGDPVAVVAAAVPFLAQVHLEDMRTGTHEHLLPGAGDVDFPGVLSALQNGHYNGPVCFELSRSSHQGPTAAAHCVALWRTLVGPQRR
jgi:sugar phosphate isomerase/epimerase